MHYVVSSQQVVGFKKLSFRPGEKAEKEVRKYQKSTKLLLKKLPFSRLVREITAELTASDGYHFAVEGIAALQEVLCIF